MNTSQPSIQETIEELMSHYGRENRWEAIYLFSTDGFPMASYTRAGCYDDSTLLEFSFSLFKTVSLLDSSQNTHEITVQGKKGRLLIFRYFTAWNECLILAAVTTGEKGYKRAMNNLVKTISQLS